MLTKKSLWITVLGCLLGMALLVTLVSALWRAATSQVGQMRRLPDGSTLKLVQVAFTATNSYNYSYRKGGPVLRLIAPVLPAFLRNRLDLSGGSFGFGLEGDTNLLVITLNRGTPPTAGSSVGRLRVFDDQGNEFDACWGANTLGFLGETVHGWQVRAFPRRSRTVGLKFLARTSNGGWTNAAEFEIPNRLFADFAQWTPEARPTTKTNGALAVTLAQFQSGGLMARRSQGDPMTDPRVTHLVCAFDEAGKPSLDWRVQKLTLSDATGNRWFPYLDFVEQEFNWTTNGTVEFLGGLWPGEKAWKLDLEVIRTAGFKPEELWEVAMPLPAPGAVATLTNTWEYEGRRVTLVGLASPNTDHAGDFRWVAKWWGEEKNRVYSLALQLGGDLRGWRLSVIRAVDQTGAEVKIVQHGSQDYPTQAVFLKPEDNASAVRLTLALQRSRFFQFLARPDFVGAGATK